MCYTQRGCTCDLQGELEVEDAASLGLVHIFFLNASKLSINWVSISYASIKGHK